MSDKINIAIFVKLLWYERNSALQTMQMYESPLYFFIHLQNCYIITAGLPTGGQNIKLQLENSSPYFTIKEECVCA